MSRYFELVDDKAYDYHYVKLQKGHYAFKLWDYDTDHKILIGQVTHGCRGWNAIPECSLKVRFISPVYSFQSRMAAVQYLLACFRLKNKMEAEDG
jgi:hypothetical protein